MGTPFWDVDGAARRCYTYLKEIFTLIVQ